MLIDPDLLAPWVATYIWTLTRIGAMLSIMPVFGGSYLPRQMRTLLAIVLSWMLLPLVPVVSWIEPLSPEGVSTTVQQLLIGFAIGFTLRAAFGALEIAGQVVAMQMGLAFASMVDPQGGSQVPLVSYFYQLLGSMLFIALDMHLVLIALLVQSFELMPIGPVGLGAEAFWRVVGLGTLIFSGGVLLSMPAIASLMAVNLAFGVMTRAAPQFNIFMVGLPITLLLGAFILLFTLPAFLPQFRALLDQTMSVAQALLR